jgi:ribosomal protein L19
METNTVIEDKVIKKIEELRKEKNPNFTSIPDFRPGDTINVAVRVWKERKKRIQNFKVLF